jgi:hypothetical protein
MDKIRIIKTSKDNDAVYIYGYIYYHKRHNRDGTVYWKCKDCQATITTHDKTVMKIGKTTSCAKEDILNSHEPHKTTSEEVLEADQSVKNIRKRVEKENVAISKAYYEEKKEYLTKMKEKTDQDMEELIACFPDLYSIKSSLYSHKWKNFPPLPHNLDELVVPSQLTITEDDKSFLLCDGKVDKERVLIFASRTGLEILSKTTQWHADGTFKSAPQMFLQVYIICGFYKDKIFPCVYSITTAKNEMIYKYIIDQIKTKAIASGLEVKPLTILLDFEKASFNAFRYHFPDIQIRGCFFHHSQCLFRKLVEHGLKSQFQSDSTFKLWFSKLVCLALIPVIKLEDGFEYIYDSRPEYTEIDKFLDYYVETWLDGFERNIWNHFENLGPRTNNHVEGYNSRFNGIVNVSHPNIWKFITCLQAEEATYTHKYVRLEKNILKERPRN